VAGEREFDVIVYGATGFTGRLVAEHMLATHGVGRGVTWAMAGRSKSKLESVRGEIGAPADLPLIIADASDAASLDAMARRSKVIITTVGPYQLYGEPLVAACAKAGTDYVDLCGEPAWMAAMIAKYDAQARASGARIVFSCGFDSIPFDLGVTFLQEEARLRIGAPLQRVRGRVRKMKGGFSGGTVASLMATLESTKKDRSILKTLANPFALTPGFTGPAQPSGEAVVLDASGQWAAPFVMATINTKNVHRSNFLLNHAWGADFVYDEMLLTGDGAAGQKRAKAAKRGGDILNSLLDFAPVRALLRALMLPKPGQGPSKEKRETGFYEVGFHGETADGRSLRASVKGDKDPGYGSTSKMISESALCLARDVGRDETPGGVWTPGAALGRKLIARLEAHAGMKFMLED
jgi:short subunit dehydrogenase-like uncharacterized protein